MHVSPAIYNVSFDPETGEIVDTVNGAIVMVNGHPVSVFIENSDEEVIEYRIPVKLNGRSADLIAMYGCESDSFDVVMKIVRWRARPSSSTTG